MSTTRCTAAIKGYEIMKPMNQLTACASWLRSLVDAGHVIPGLKEWAAVLDAAGAEPVQEWREAVLDELAMCCMDAPIGTPPRDILKDIVHWHICVATDPAVNGGYRLVKDGVEGPSYAELISALAACRDAFPVPERGSEADNAWVQAMGDPVSVPMYVRAALATLAPTYITWDEHGVRLVNGVPDDAGVNAPVEGKSSVMGMEMPSREVLDGLGQQCWSDSRYSGRDGQDFDHVKFAQMLLEHVSGVTEAPASEKCSATSDMTAENALENCRLYAARERYRNRNGQEPEWVANILRFCEEGGATGSPLLACEYLIARRFDRRY